MREREVYMLYEINKKSNIVIQTPVGMTDNISVHEIVKQGTIFGPKLCSVATENINNNNNNNCLKSNIQCIEIRVQWTVHLGSSHMHVNGIGEEISTHITPELTIGASVYVDDILGIGDCKSV